MSTSTATFDIEGQSQPEQSKCTQCCHHCWIGCQDNWVGVLIVLSITFMVVCTIVAYILLWVYEPETAKFLSVITFWSLMLVACCQSLEKR